MSAEEAPPREISNDEVAAADQEEEEAVDTELEKAVDTELEKAVDDLIPLIQSSADAPTKEYLLGYLLGMTATNDGMQVISRNHSLIGALKENMCEVTESAQVKKDCLNILVNTTSESRISKDSSSAFSCLLRTDSLCALFTETLNSQSSLADVSAMLLTNLSQAEENAREVHEFIRMNVDVANLQRIFDAFCHENYNPSCQLHHLGSVLANLTQLSMIREELLRRDGDYIKRVIPFLGYDPSVTRRLAAARIIRNCVLDIASHEWLLGEDVDILSQLLLPLAGGEEFNEEDMEKLPLDLQYLPTGQRREKDADVVVLIAETIFRLCCTKSCRLQIKSSGADIVISRILADVNNDLAADKDPMEERTIAGDIEQSRTVYPKLDMLLTMLLSEEPEEGSENFLDYELPENFSQKPNDSDISQFPGGFVEVS